MRSETSVDEKNKIGDDTGLDENTYSWKLSPRSSINEDTAFISQRIHSDPKFSEEEVSERRFNISVAEDTIGSFIVDIRDVETSFGEE